MALLHQLSEADWFVLKASTTADPVSHRGDPCKDYDIYRKHLGTNTNNKVVKQRQ